MPSYQKLEGKTIVSFPYKLDTVTCMDFEDDLFEHINEESGLLIFDLREVSYISSMFLRVCTKTLQKTSKERFLIINAGEPVMKVFKLTGLLSLLNVS